MLFLGGTLDCRRARSAFSSGAMGLRIGHWAFWGWRFEGLALWVNVAQGTSSSILLIGVMVQRTSNPAMSPCLKCFGPERIHCCGNRQGDRRTGPILQ